MNRRSVHPALLTILLATASALASDYPHRADGGILFTYRDEGARHVAWAGDYNEWNTNADAFTDDGSGIFTIVIPLAPGEHQYKFVVDGNWITDPSNPQIGGDYGNSVVRVDGKGEVVEAGGGPQPSPLNSKLFVDGFYYVRMKAESLPSEGGRWQVEKPTHDLNLGFDVQLNPSLAARIELNADNVAHPSEMWRTALNFQRARLVLTRPAFTLTLFDNDAIFLSDEILGLVGRVDTYAYDYGYNARGALYEMALPLGFDLSFLAADAGIAAPWRPADPDTSSTGNGAGLEVNYNRAENEGARDDWAIQLERPLGPGRALYLGHAVRGLSPGNLWFRENLGAEGYDSYYYRTVQNNLLHAMSYRIAGDRSFLEVEGILGKSVIQGTDRSWLHRGTEAFTETELDERSWRVQDSRGLALAAGGPLPWGFSWSGRHSFEENRNTLIDGEGEPSARALRYGGDIDWKSRRAAWDLHLDQAEFHYDDGLAWGDQFVFAAGEVGYGNSWIKGDHLPLDAYSSLGYGSVSRLRQSLRVLLREGSAGDMTLNLRQTVASTRLDRKPFYWEVIGELDWPFSEEWSLLLNQRMARYDQDFLGLKGDYRDSFLELSFHINKRSYLALGWGVDPYWLDPVSKRFLPYGRREYLAEQGLDETALKESYLGLGAVVKRAEAAMRDARRLTLEAHYVF